MRDYDKFLNSTIGSKKSLKNLNVVGGNKLHNHLLEWSQLLQKICIQENPSNNAPNESDDKLYKAYETILKLDERNWYEEMVLLYKVISKKEINLLTYFFRRRISCLKIQQV